MERLQTSGEISQLHMNLIIYTELLVPAPNIDALDALREVYDTLRSPLPWPCASLAAAAFRLYRRRGGLKQVTLPDFFIGAHAAVSNLRVITRNPNPYKNYFLNLTVVSP